MSSDRWRRVELLFERAADLEGQARDGYLERECADAPELLEVVRSLLASDAEAGRFLEGPLGDGDAPSLASQEVTEGQYIGAYRLLDVVGVGGMSTVYRAQRDEESRREVALKVIRQGLESAASRRRLVRERQILAGLEHPHIARLYDGGVTQDGLPYFVMELVQGRPLDRFCDEQRLSLDDRLNLFLKVCGAVSYAHQRLVVHRDLKPGNILVREDGEPKLLDFGISRVLDPLEDGVGGEVTAAWLRVMTPHYASPEQIQGRGAHTASDVYSLGVLLYRLLTGRLPFDLESLSLFEIERLVSTRDPIAASERWRQVEVAAPGSGSDAQAELREICQQRQITADQLSRLLEGDLDTILAKALRRDPERRYASVEQLAEDLRRHRTGFPVLARPDDWSYRAGKFLRRNGWPVAFGALLLALVMASAAALAVQGKKVRHERDQLKEVIRFVVEVFNVAGEEEEEMTVRQAVDRSSALLATKLRDQREVRSTLRHTLGRIYLNLGVSDQALAQLEEAVSLRRESFGPESLEMSESLSSLGLALTLEGAFDEGERVAREALALRRARVGADDVRLIEPLNTLVSVLCYRGDKNEDAMALADEALHLARQERAADPSGLADALSHRALLAIEEGDSRGAREGFLEALEIYRRQLGERHPEVAAITLNLASATWRAGDRAAAEKLYREALILQQELFRQPSSAVAQTQNNLASLLREQGRFKESEGYYRQALETVGTLHGADHFSSLLISTGLAQTMNADHRPQEAESLLRAGLELWRPALAGSWLLANADRVLGESLLRQGRIREAAPLLEEGYRALAEALGPDDPRTRETAARLEELQALPGQAGAGQAR